MMVLPDSKTTRPERRSLAAGPHPERRPDIDLRDVSKTFDNGTQALQDITFSVAADEFVAVVGSSGCGKSTLLRIIAGLAPVSGGTVEVFGSPVTGPRPEIGLMFQQPALLDWGTALDNVLVPVRLRRRVGRDDVVEALRLLHLFGLNGFEYRFPQQLSGGMQQRVALARLLMTGASVRLLDEPFGALDEITRERLNFELARVHEQTRSATVLITHNIYEAVLLSDRVIVMSPRPGTVAAEIDVPLDRPRSVQHLRRSAFQNIVADVRDALQMPAEEER